MVVFAGIIGTVKENYCCLLIYAIILGLSVFVELALAVSLFALAANNSLGSVLESTMTTSLDHFNQSGYDGVTKGKIYLVRPFCMEIASMGHFCAVSKDQRPERTPLYSKRVSFVPLT